jgi:hypothetical protein
MMVGQCNISGPSVAMRCGRKLEIGAAQRKRVLHSQLSRFLLIAIVKLMTKKGEN